MRASTTTYTPLPFRAQGRRPQVHSSRRSSFPPFSRRTNIAWPSPRESCYVVRSLSAVPTRQLSLRSAFSTLHGLDSSPAKFTRGLRNIARPLGQIAYAASGASAPSLDTDDDSESRSSVSPMPLRALLGISLIANIAVNSASGVWATVLAVNEAHPTFLTPAGWGFDIWGLVYALQGVGILAWLGLAGGEGGSVVEKEASTAGPLWALSWAFQSAWLQLFAQKSFGLSALCLSGATACMLLAVARLRAFRPGLATLRYFGFIIPTAVNAAWLTTLTATALLQCLAAYSVPVLDLSAWGLIFLLLFGQWAVEAPSSALPWASGEGEDAKKPHLNPAYSLGLLWALQAVWAERTEIVVAWACLAGTGVLVGGLLANAYKFLPKVVSLVQAARLLNVRNIGLFSDSLKGVTKTALVDSVYDGDTVTVRMFFNGTAYLWKVRMNGFDSPELRTKNKLEKKAGYVVRDYLRSKIKGQRVRLECSGFDKYGRLLADLYYADENINKHLISKGYGKPYAGGTKDMFTTAELEEIIGDEEPSVSEDDE
ncbi:hypothetical protein CYMTET_43130 [Cymbomonas tetramitiformis]|uniref:TNase-like domain-containing protein n=1 Tax=Cymbomonas tetramitiformis TaxID=36881 RepID=A0AAE0C2U6_9CHLO|nr:hypothetical protein CYMTET_43130 [Cymbomonas tetramitiformis]